MLLTHPSPRPSPQPPPLPDDLKYLPTIYPGDALLSLRPRKA